MPGHVRQPLSFLDHVVQGFSWRLNHTGKSGYLLSLQPLSPFQRIEHEAENSSDHGLVFLVTSSYPEAT